MKRLSHSRLSNGAMIAACGAGSNLVQAFLQNGQVDAAQIAGPLDARHLHFGQLPFPQQAINRCLAFPAFQAIDPHPRIRGAVPQQADAANAAQQDPGVVVFLGRDWGPGRQASQRAGGGLARSYTLRVFTL